MLLVKVFVILLILNTVNSTFFSYYWYRCLFTGRRRRGKIRRPSRRRTTTPAPVYVAPPAPVAPPKKVVPPANVTKVPAVKPPIPSNGTIVSSVPPLVTTVPSVGNVTKVPTVPILSTNSTGFIDSNSTISLTEGCTNTKYFVGACEGDWHAAFVACALHNMELVIIDSSKKQKEVELAISGCKPKDGINNGFWIGGYRISDLEKWTWLSTGKEMTDYTKWGPGTPRGGPKQCMEIYRESKSKSYFWNDLPCNMKFTNKRYICQNKMCGCKGFNVPVPSSPVKEVPPAEKIIPPAPIPPLASTVPSVGNVSTVPIVSTNSTGFTDSNSTMTSLTEGCTNTKFFVGACEGDWHSAFVACALHNMELVIIDSSIKQKEVELAISGCKPKDGINNGFWIGGYRISDLKKWTWLSTGKEMTDYTKWGPGTPRGGPKQCMEIYRDSKSKSYFWNDLPCNMKFTNKRYICQNKICGCDASNVPVPPTPVTNVPSIKTVPSLKPPIPTNGTIVSLIPPLASTVPSVGNVTKVPTVPIVSTKSTGSFNSSIISLTEGCTNTKFFVGACEGDWHTAFVACALHNMELVIIDSSMKQKEVELAISSCKPKDGVNNGFWIGGYRISDLEKWTWLSTGKEMSDYTKWGPGKPRGGPKRCMEIYRESKSKSYFWNDLSCTMKFTHKRYICQNKMSV